MSNFLTYHTTSPNYLSFSERLIPLTIITMLVMVILIHRTKLIVSPKLNHNLLHVVGVLLGSLLIVQFVLKWVNDGFTRFTLPFDYLTLSIVLTLILIFTKSKHLYRILIYTNVLVGMTSLLFSDIGHSFQSFSYYYFIIGHSLNILVALYFLIIYNYSLSIKSALSTVIAIIGFTTFTLLLNAVLETEYSNLVIGKNPAPDTSLVGYLGDWPWYVLAILFVMSGSTFIWYATINYLINRDGQTDNQSISSGSSYMTKKKSGPFSK